MRPPSWVVHLARPLMLLYNLYVHSMQPETMLPRFCPHAYVRCVGECVSCVIVREENNVWSLCFEFLSSWLDDYSSEGLVRSSLRTYNYVTLAPFSYRGSGPQSPRIRFGPRSCRPKDLVLGPRLLSYLQRTLILSRSRKRKVTEDVRDAAYSCILCIHPPPPALPVSQIPNHVSRPGRVKRSDKPLGTSTADADRIKRLSIRSRCQGDLHVRFYTPRRGQRRQRAL